MCGLPLLQFAADVLKAAHVVVKGDSQLAVRQMKGEYRWVDLDTWGAACAHAVCGVEEDM